MGRPFPPSKLPLPMAPISIGSAVRAGITSVTDRLTDRPTDHAIRSVTTGRIYVRSTAMRPKTYTI